MTVLKACLSANNDTDYLTGWKLEVIGMKYFTRKIEMQINSTHLVVEQNNYTKKVGNVSIVYDLDKWLKSNLEILH